VLSGERVRLEPIAPGRARAILSGQPEPELPWENGFPLAPLRELLSKVAIDDEGAKVLGPFFAYVIVRKADGRAVGDAGFHGPPNDEGELEIGYALVPGARGAGLASESVRLLIAWARTQPGVGAITARVEPGNSPSERLLRRAGFRLDGQRAGMLRFVLDD
jgi:GNAT superfamily N-acetyltransferase